MARNTEPALVQMSWELGRRWAAMQQAADYAWTDLRNHSDSQESERDNSLDGFRSTLGDLEGMLRAFAESSDQDIAAPVNNLLSQLEAATNELLNRLGDNGEFNTAPETTNEPILARNGERDFEAERVNQIRRRAPYWGQLEVPFQPDDSDVSEWMEMERRFQRLLASLSVGMRAAITMRFRLERECYPYAGVPSYWSQTAAQKVSYLQQLQADLLADRNSLATVVGSIKDLNLEISLQTDNGEIQQQLIQLLNQAANSIETTEQVLPHYQFGVQLNWLTNEVSRNGNEANPVRLTPREFKLFYQIVLVKDNLLDMAGCIRAYEAQAGDEKGVREALSEINKKIPPLGIFIENNPRKGWRLAEGTKQLRKKQRSPAKQPRRKS